MTTAVEVLDKLERRVTITVALADVKQEVEKRLKVQARTAKAPGFRPGKVPLKMVAAQYGYQIETEVLNDKVGRAFYDATVANDIRVAGLPSIAPKETQENQADGTVVFDATFEVYPEVSIGDLSGLELDKFTTEVDQAELDKTIDILRKQRAHYHVKGEQSDHGDGGSDLTAKNDDRVTIDFEGKIDDVAFPGGSAEDYAFVLGQGRMLPEFEAATVGLKVGESKTFPLTFPEDYHGKDVAGKTAQFTVTLKQIEWPHLPELDSDFVKSLGIESGDVEKLRSDILENLQREVRARLKSKNKEGVMQGLLDVCQFDVPTSLIKEEENQLVERARKDMEQRGMNVKDMPIPTEIFTEQAVRRVRLGLILAELVKSNQLEAKTEQVKTYIEEFAKSYEDPQQVVKYYFSDRRRLGEIEALVLEENVVAYVYGQAKLIEKTIPFDELMGNNPERG